MLGGDTYGFYMYYASKLNRADGPTAHSLILLIYLSRVGGSGLPKVTLMHFDQWLGSVSLAANNGAAESLLFGAEEHLTQGPPPQTCAVPAPCSSQHGKFVWQGKMPSPTDLVGPALDEEARAILESFALDQVLSGSDVDKFVRSGALDLHNEAFIRFGACRVVTFERERSAADNLLNEELRLVQPLLLVFGRGY